jgi:hypothetical protein
MLAAVAEDFAVIAFRSVVMKNALGDTVLHLLRVSAH